MCMCKPTKQNPSHTPDEANLDDLSWDKHMMKSLPWGGLIIVLWEKNPGFNLICGHTFE